MFKTFIEIFRKEDLLRQAFNESLIMLQECYEMFTKAVHSLRKSDVGEIGVNIYDKDKIVNKYEREVRRKVLTHLAVNAPKDLYPGLVLVIIVMDIERIGDYCKNIVELALNHPRRLDVGKLKEEFEDIETKLIKRFEILIEAFKKSDVDLARSLMQQHRANTQRCDKMVYSLIREEISEYSSGDAVAIAMYARYLKRVSSHITNIASSIVNPFHRIGFKEKMPEEELD
ncbi:hypothetical protein ISS30_09480 [bacterium]|nr:hypothetical protein [FCB group bacterium]MBL7191917.1 hypothetical protein [bacterium]